MTGGKWTLDPCIFIIWSTINPGWELDGRQLAIYYFIVSELFIRTYFIDTNILFMIKISKVAWKRFSIFHHASSYVLWLSLYFHFEEVSFSSDFNFRYLFEWNLQRIVVFINIWKLGTLSPFHTHCTSNCNCIQIITIMNNSNSSKSFV